MEKISGIIPSSSRVASVDMREAAPVRPGTPSFGRPEGVSSLRQAKLGDTAAAATKIGKERLDWKSKDKQQAAMARELSDRFFKGNQAMGPEKIVDIDARPLTMDQPRASVAAGFDTSAIDRVTGSGSFAGKSSSTTDFDDDEFSLPEVVVFPTTGAVPASASAEPAMATEQPNGLHPRGSFIDVRA